MLRLLVKEAAAVTALQREYETFTTTHPLLRAVTQLRANADAARKMLVAEQERLARVANYFDGDHSRFKGIFERYALAPEEIDRQYEIVLQPREGEYEDDHPITGNPVMKKWAYDPTKLKFTKLPWDGRACLLAPFLRIMVGDCFPRLDLARSTRTNLVYTVDNGVLDAAAWKAALPHINSFLGSNWTVRSVDTVSVRLRRAAKLPPIIPFDTRYLRRGQVFYGFDTSTGDPIYIPLAAMTHTLAVGQSGSGKSVYLNQVLLSLLFNADLIGGLTLVDLKGGVELARYDGVIDKIRVVTEYEELPEVAASLVALMRQRLAEMRKAGRRSITEQQHFVVIDEFAAIQFQAFADKEKKQRHNQLLADLNLLAAQARAPGIKLWAQLQKPTADAMDTSFRTNLQSISAFKVPNLNAALILDGLDDVPAKPSGLSKGQYLLRLDGQPDRIVQSSFVPDEIPLEPIVDLGRKAR